MSEDSPGGSDSKASAYNVGDPDLIPGWGRSPGEGNGNPLQYCCLENPMDRGAWKATVYGVKRSWTQLSDFTSLQAMPESLWLLGLQHASLLCLPLSPGVCSYSCPLSQWCHTSISPPFPAISLSNIRIFSTSGGQSIGASALETLLPMKIQGWFPLELTGLISLLSKGLSTVFSSTTFQKHQLFSAQPSL